MVSENNAVLANSLIVLCTFDNLIWLMLFMGIKIFGLLVSFFSIIQKSPLETSCGFFVVPLIH